jgi:hypothetical protein
MPGAFLTKTSQMTEQASPPRDEATQLAEFAAALFPISTLPFQTVGIIGDLLAHGLPADAWLNQCGVYAVLLPLGYDLQILDESTVHAAQNVIAPLSDERLRDKWIPGTRVAYVGFAGNLYPVSLRKRLRDFLRHAAGETTDRGPHRWGESLWQLAGHEEFAIMALATSGPPAPRETERDLLARFSKRFGGVPFGNRGSSEDAVAVPATETGTTTLVAAEASTRGAPAASRPANSNPTASVVRAALAAATALEHGAVVRNAWESAPADMTLADLIKTFAAHGFDAAFLAMKIAELRGDRPA